MMSNIIISRVIFEVFHGNLFSDSRFLTQFAFEVHKIVAITVEIYKDLNPPKKMSFLFCDTKGASNIMIAFSN